MAAHQRSYVGPTSRIPDEAEPANTISEMRCAGCLATNDPLFRESGGLSAGRGSVAGDGRSIDQSPLTAQLGGRLRERKDGLTEHVLCSPYPAADCARRLCEASLTAAAERTLRPPAAKSTRSLRPSYISSALETDPRPPGHFLGVGRSAYDRRVIAQVMVDQHVARSPSKFCYCRDRWIYYKIAG
jgi:hypothetical protein